MLLFTTCCKDKVENSVIFRKTIFSPKLFGIWETLLFINETQKLDPLINTFTCASNKIIRQWKYDIIDTITIRQQKFKIDNLVGEKSLESEQI